MAIGDEDLCPYHEKRLVAVFCQTCEEMICTMCISQGQHAGARHRDHAFLDLEEAYDLVKEDMEKLVGRFKDHLEMKKKERQNVQGRLQQTKFELLRKRSLMERRSRSISDKLKRAEKKFLSGLESLVSPAVTKTELKWKELEYEVLSDAWYRYEVVSREGMLGSAESLSRLPSTRAVTYLKHIVRTKREMQKAMDKDNKSGSVYEKLQRQCSGFNTLRRVSLTLHGEKRTIGKVFRMPKSVPSPPKVLYSWCVIGATNSTVAWKFLKSEKVDRFLVCWHQVDVKQSPSESSFQIPCKKKNCSKTSVSVFKSGRCQMVLRNLKERAWYKIQIQAMNLLGESKPCVAFFITRSVSSDWFKYEGEMFTRAPVNSVYAKLPSYAHRTFLVVIVSMYAAVMLYLALWSYDRITDRENVTAHAQMIEGGRCRCFVGDTKVLPPVIEPNKAEETSSSKWFGL